MNLDKLFHDRSTRGEARGADQVWHHAFDRKRTVHRRRIAVVVPLVAVAAAAVAAFVIPTSLLADDNRRNPAGTAASTQTSAPTSPDAPSPTATGLDLVIELSERYRQCAIEAGFNPLGVQVNVDGKGRATDVKTGRDVPAHVHGPCLQALGGPDPLTSSWANPHLTSSWGNPTALGECEWGVDLTPPIDGDPVPTQSFPGSVIENQGTSTPQGGVPVTLQLATSERLRIPRDLTVECWNGQRWRPAYVVIGLGDDNPRVSEIESGVEPTDVMLPVSESELDLPVPEAAPDWAYRIVDTAERCSATGVCERVPFSVTFRVTKP